VCPRGADVPTWTDDKDKAARRFTENVRRFARPGFAQKSPAREWHKREDLTKTMQMAEKRPDLNNQIRSFFRRLTAGEDTE